MYSLTEAARLITGDSRGKVSPAQVAELMATLASRGQVEQLLVTPLSGSWMIAFPSSQETAQAIYQYWMMGGSSGPAGDAAAVETFGRRSQQIMQAMVGSELKILNRQEVDRVALWMEVFLFVLPKLGRPMKRDAQMAAWKQLHAFGEANQRVIVGVTRGTYRVSRAELVLREALNEVLVVLAHGRAADSRVIKKYQQAMNKWRELTRP